MAFAVSVGEADFAALRKEKAYDEDKRRAIIIEAKKSGKESDMDKDCDEALDQIVRKKYAEGLYGYEQILCFGAAFYQKQVRIKRLQ